MIKEFKDFIARGNVLDLAIAVIMSSSFGAIVSSLVDNILMPIIGALTAGIDFEQIKLTILGVDLGIGLFINAIIKFIIIAFVMFLIIKAFNTMKKEAPKEVVKTKACPACKENIHLDATRCPHCTTIIE